MLRFPSVLLLLALLTVACGSSSQNDLLSGAGGVSGSDGSTGGSGGAGGMSGAGGDAPDSATCWPFAPTNFDPCIATFDTMYPSMGPYTVAGPKTLDTNVDGYTGPGGVALFRFDTITVEIGQTLTIKGDRPALLMADGDVKIYGSIVVQSTSVMDASCSTDVDAGNPSTNGSPGGGGGGYGSPGGNGGTTVSTAPGGAISGTVEISPLRGGCRGGKSGTGTKAGVGPSTPGVNGGKGGGALEISSKTMILIQGSITADGDGGQGGGATKAGASPCDGQESGHNCTSGGGGGGSGGAILPESAEVSVTGSVCAVGGGAGAGGDGGGNGTPGASGASGVACTAGVGGTGGGTAAGGNGGGTSPATAGASAGNFSSGGGGGGGSGRIRLRSAVKPLSTNNATVAPAPVVI